MTPLPPSDSVPIETLLSHRAWVRALARRLVSDPNAADDVEQETWRMALERPPRHDASVRAWFSAVARNAARMAGRGRTRRSRHEAAARERPPAASPADVVAEAELQHRLVGAVLALGEPYRSAVLARFFEGREAAEIAERTGVPVETVRTRIKRGVAMLRERMSEEIGDDREAWCLLLVGSRFGEGAPPAGGPAGTIAPAAGTAGAAATAGVAGGVAMGVAAKFGVGVATAVVALVAWTILRPSGTGDRGLDVGIGTATEDASGAAAARGPRSRARAAEDRSTAASSAAAGVGNARLDAADRDLDVFGVVVRKDGTPVPDATVEAVSYPWRRAPTLNWGGAREAVAGPSTTTDADGVFVLRLVRGANVALRVTKSGFARTELGERQAGERLRVVLEPGVRLVVVAKDAAGGAAVAGVPLRVTRALSQIRDVQFDLRGTTDAAGTCSFPDLPAGVDGHVFPESALGCAPVAFELAATGETRLDMVLGGGRTLRGRVTDAATGAPVAGARVGMSWLLVGAVNTGADGTYVLAGWGARTYGDVQAAATGFVRSGAVPSESDVIDFALRPGIRARGRIVGPGGGGVAGALASCIGWRGDGSDRHISSADAVTGADGVFSLSGLDADSPHVLTVVAQGAGRVQREIRFAPGTTGEADLGDVALPAARAIEGVALDPSGNPATRALVTLVGPDAPAAVARLAHYGNRESRRTDDLGRFRFPDLAPGRYVVELARPNGTTATAQVDLPADKDVLGLSVPPQTASDGALEVTVADDAGRPIANATVVGRTNDGSGAATATTDAAGRAVVGPAPNGRITRIEMGSPIAGGPFLTHRGVRVSRGHRDVRIVLQRGTAVRYRIEDPDGKPLPMAQVAVEPAGVAFAGMSNPDGTGSLVLPHDGTFALVFDGAVTRHRNGAWTIDDTGLEARADGVTASSREVVLRCRRVPTGRAMTVRVLESDGTAAKGVGMTILTGGGVRLAHGTTDDEGRARFDDLPARTLQVFVGAREGDLHPGVVRAVPDGGEVVVRFPSAIVISGTATWSDGTPLAAFVNVYRVGGDEDLFLDSSRADADGRFTVKVPAGDDGPFEIEAATQRADRTYTGVRRPLAPTDRDVQLIVPR